SLNKENGWGKGEFSVVGNPSDQGKPAAMAKKQEKAPDETAKTNPDAAPAAEKKPAGDKPAGEKKPRKPKESAPDAAATAPAVDGAPVPTATAVAPADGQKKKKK